MKKNKIIKIAIVPILIITILILTIILIIIKTFSLDSEINYESQIYKIEDNYIYNVSPYTSISLYKKYFDLKNCNIKIIDENNNELQSKYIYNGSKTIIYDNSNNIIKKYINIITGDINPDGEINSKDIEKLAEYLIKRTELAEYQIKAMDINNNNEIKVSDLILLKDTLTNGYQTLTLNKDNITLMTNEKERLIPTILPNKILNQNLTWTSSDTKVAIIDESGIITPLQEGEAIITATTSDGKITATSKVIVDNTVKLNENNKTIYPGGNDAIVEIKAVDYDELTCNSNDEEIATCQIKDKTLVIKPIGIGNTTITVLSPTYEDATIEITSVDTYFKLFPNYACIPINRTAGPGVISPFNAGEIKLFEISDLNIIKNGYIENKGFYITANSTPGTAQVTFIEDNGNKKESVTIDVYNLKIQDYGGFGYIKGEEFSSEIIAENTGGLTCTSQNPEIATCKIIDNRIVVTPQKEAEVIPGKTYEIYMDVTGSKCGSTNYLAVLRSEVTE